MFIFACFSFHACNSIIARFFAHVLFWLKNLFKQRRLLASFNYIPCRRYLICYVLFYHYATYTSIPVYRYLWYSGIPAKTPEPEWLSLPHPTNFPTTSSITRHFVFIDNVFSSIVAFNKNVCLSVFKIQSKRSLLIKLLFISNNKILIIFSQIRCL